MLQGPQDLCQLSLKGRNLPTQLNSLSTLMCNLQVQSLDFVLLFHQLQAQVPYHCWLTAADTGTALQQLQPHIRG